ncbi:MAG: DUF3293 domain-containing protein [Fimbriimonadales bacterium]|nr:DUF3293 domain-containing protein [Fimbriimonadales bacterium]
MNHLVESYLKTELIFSTPDGMSWGAVSDTTQGSVSKPGGVLGLLDLEVSSALIITAWNPLGRECYFEQNEALQSNLIIDLQKRGLTFIPVLGQEPGGGWKEESLLIPNRVELKTFEQVYLLADNYEQNAIFEITDTTKRLVGVRMKEIFGESGYRLLPLGTQSISKDV